MPHREVSSEPNMNLDKNYRIIADDDNFILQRRKYRSAERNAPSAAKRGRTSAFGRIWGRHLNRTQDGAGERGLIRPHYLN